MFGADVPLRLVLMEVTGHPLDVVAGSGEVFQTVAEQIIVVGLDVDLAAVLEELTVVDELARVGEAVLVGRAVLAPRIADWLLYTSCRKARNSGGTVERF